MTAKHARILDRLGIGVSLSCAIHCTLLPIITALLPFIGLKFLANQYLEMIIIFSSVVIACSSLFITYKRHKRPTALFLALAGFALIVIGRYLVNDTYEWLPLAIGGSLVAYAHYKNMLFSKYHEQCTYRHR